MNKRILIKSELCNGCGICELVCALARTGQWDPALARVNVLKDYERSISLPVFCGHCENPPCAQACLMNVIDKDPDNGLMVRNEEFCIGCHACELACPFGASCFNFLDEVAVNCDLCGGAPLCVEYCPSQALYFDYPANGSAYKREDAARKLLQKYQREGELG